MVFIWFIYSLAFFALGLAIFVYPKRGSRFRLAKLTLEKVLTEMAESDAPDAIRRAVGRGLSEVAKAGETLGRFLSIAHPGAAGTEQPVGLYQIARRTAGVFADSARRKRLTIAIKEMDIVPPLMAVSPRGIE
jgi:hypothetical protein